RPGSMARVTFSSACTRPKRFETERRSTRIARPPWSRITGLLDVRRRTQARLRIDEDRAGRMEGKEPARGVEQREARRAAEEREVRTRRPQVAREAPELVGHVADAVAVEVVAAVVVEVVARPLDAQR